MIETILHVVLDILHYMIIGGAMVAGVWILALVTIVTENRLKKWGKEDRR